MSRRLDSTPRVGPADFPITPQTSAQRQVEQARERLSTTIRRQAANARSPVPSLSYDPEAPTIPLTLLDAPTQRTLAFAIYGALLAWKFLDFWSIYGYHETESFWLFMKWAIIDCLFLLALVSFKIPWLAWAPASMVSIMLVHIAVDACMFFQIGLPLTVWFESFVKLFYEREMAISERRVKPHSVLDHSSLIMGKQVINILPEGSALLNPHNEFFCIGGSTNQIQLPIQINQTQPIAIDILRRDFDMSTEEIISIKSSEARKLRKAAIDFQKRSKGSLQPNDPLVLRYTVRKPGQYTILKIVDESKLDVRPRPSEVLVVECPSAKIKTEGMDRCRGELSDIFFDVQGTAPLKVKYRKLVNGIPTEAQFQSIQPDDFVSPFSKRYKSAVVKVTEKDFSWAKSHTVKVPINETMISLGKYSYAIDEVQDALGNMVVYSASLEDDEINKLKHPDIINTISVHDRPLLFIPTGGCNSERPLQVASGRTIQLQHKIISVGKTESEMQYRNDYKFDEPHFIEYDFTPEDQLKLDPAFRTVQTVKFKKLAQSEQLTVKEPGLYTWKSISTKYCRGEVSEPSACLLQNPIKPSVKITSTEMTHKCANSPIGLRVDFEFQGSPPFTVRWLERKDGSKNVRQHSEQFEGHKGRVELVPGVAGQYRYEFTEIRDNFYEVNKLKEILQQDVRPSASASIDRQFVGKVQNLCIGHPAEFKVHLKGDSPWTLEYEIIHGKSRQKIINEGITDAEYYLKVDDIKDGGQYTLSLSSVSDRSGCKEFLKDEAGFHVWSQVPSAGFGLVNGRQSAQILEGKSIALPVKFTGQPPFTYSLQNQDTGDIYSDSTDHANGAIKVSTPGNYIITSPRDRFCAGVVDSIANSFVISWISRPSLSISQHPSIEVKGSKYIKTEVCEGDEDFVELTLQGTPPFDLAYEEHGKTDEGKSFRKKELNIANGIASIQMDTLKSGNYEYKFHDVSDANYNPHAKSRSNIVLQQQVNPRPTAKFTTPGKIYSYCTSETSDDSVIPITFTGVPPFNLDVDVRSSGSAAPEPITLNDIQTNQYELRLPRKHLRTGHSHLTIRRVRDGRNCQSKPDTSVAPSRVQISVHEPPKIVPLESKTDFCVGERISYRLEGVTPFTVFYTFDRVARKASSKKSEFRRLAERPGDFVVTGLADSSSACRFATELHKTIHALPSVKMSQGRESVVDIHEGGEAEILLEFTGEPPFEFTYTRAETARGGKKGRVLETKTDRTDDFKVRLKASEEGTYEVISIRDRWCGVSKAGAGDGRSERLLTE